MLMVDTLLRYVGKKSKLILLPFCRKVAPKTPISYHFYNPDCKSLFGFFFLQKKERSISHFFRHFIIVAFLLTGCTAFGAQQAPSATPIVIVKEIATVGVTPTLNATAIEATRAATTPTPITPTVTPTLEATAYVGNFIGEARDQDIGEIISAPIYQANPLVVFPTADATTCETPIGSEYRNAWRDNPVVNQRMGCPIQESFGFFGIVQVFEGGAMYRSNETGEIWAIVPDDNFGQYWYVESADPIELQGSSPPAGFLAPEGSFATVWASVEGLQDRLGFALTEQVEIPMGAQRYDGGIFLFDGSIGEVFALIIDGSAYGPLTSSQ